MGRALFLATVLAFAPIAAYADAEAREHIGNMMIIKAAYGKCLGRVIRWSAEEERMASNFYDWVGATDEDILAGELKGVMAAEEAYPGRTKPTKRECAAFAKNYDVIMSAMRRRGQK
jgi:hypothetical protein